MSINNHFSADHEDFADFLDLVESETRSGKTSIDEYYILSAFIETLTHARRGSKASTILSLYHQELDGLLGVAHEVVL